MRSVRSVSSDERYAAKLLFQFRVGPASQSGVRLCEERIVMLSARSPDEAYRKAEKLGAKGKLSYLNDEGQPVHFEFVGIVELIHLGPECTDEQVWYEIKRMSRPMERRKALIPSKDRLAAFRFCVEPGRKAIRRK